MEQPDPFLLPLDVDDTLLDNGEFISDRKRLTSLIFGDECQQPYWTIFENLRAEVVYADYRDALWRYPPEALHDPDFVQIFDTSATHPTADATIDYIGELLQHDLPALVSAARPAEDSGRGG